MPHATNAAESLGASECVATLPGLLSPKVNALEIGACAAGPKQGTAEFIGVRIYRNFTELSRDRTPWSAGHAQWAGSLRGSRPTASVKYALRPLTGGKVLFQIPG